MHTKVPVVRMGEKLTLKWKLFVQGIPMHTFSVSARLSCAVWAPGERLHPPTPLTGNAGPSGTQTHLLYGGLQGHMQVVHPCQLHRLIDALGCQRVSSENGVGVPGKQHQG